MPDDAASLPPEQVTWIAETAAAAALGTEMAVADSEAQRRSARRVTVVIDAIRSAR